MNKNEAVISTLSMACEMSLTLKTTLFILICNYSTHHVPDTFSFTRIKQLYAHYRASYKSRPTYLTGHSHSIASNERTLTRYLKAIRSGVRVIKQLQVGYCNPRGRAACSRANWSQATAIVEPQGAITHCSVQVILWSVLLSVHALQVASQSCRDKFSLYRALKSVSHLFPSQSSFQAHFTNTLLFHI